MQNFMMVWSRNQDMKSGETCSFLAKEKDCITLLFSKKHNNYLCMKKKIVVYVLMAFIALFLIFRFVSISNNISLQRGIVRSVSATEHNDIVIELENDSFYYINRGMESEINYEWFQNYLPGHEIELYIQNEHLFGSNSNRIVEVSINDSGIYKK